MTSTSPATDRLRGEISLTELDQVSGGMSKTDAVILAAAVCSPLFAACLGVAMVAHLANGGTLASPDR